MSKRLSWWVGVVWVGGGGGVRGRRGGKGVKNAPQHKVVCGVKNICCTVFERTF